MEGGGEESYVVVDEVDEVGGCCSECVVSVLGEAASFEPEECYVFALKEDVGYEVECFGLVVLK